MCNNNNGQGMTDICAFVVAPTPEDGDKTREKYAGWVAGMYHYALVRKSHLNDLIERGTIELVGRHEIDSLEFLNNIAVMETDDGESYAPLSTRCDETDTLCSCYHATTEMALCSVFTYRPTICIFSDNISNAVTDEYSGELDKLRGDPTEFVGLPICFYFGNSFSLFALTHCTYCIAALRERAENDFQLILLYGNEDVKMDEKYGVTHYIPFNSRSEVEEYIDTMSAPADKVLVNMFIRTMNGELSRRG